MKLTLIGHNYQYATEQMLLTLFPGERPEYPSSPPAEGENALSLRLFPGNLWATATAKLTYGGKSYTASARVRAPTADMDKVETDRALQRCLKNAFYRAGAAALGREPPWGALTGVRPVKIPTKVLRRGGSLSQADAVLKDYRVAPLRRKLALACAQRTVEAEQSLSPDEVSLYVGVPFCPTRCSYCSFISADVHRALSLVEPYAQALEREISALAQAVRRQGTKVRTVYWGGGTPTTLSPALLDRLLTRLEVELDLSRLTEYTVEAGRPDTVTAEKLAALAAHGVGRISVNPQSMSDAVLKAIGRSHTAADILTAYDLARHGGPFDINMDLIAGLPGDTVAGFRSTLEQVLALAPENITVHTLALKKGAALAQTGTPLPTGEEVSAMLDAAWSALEGAGYRPYYLYRQKYMSGGFENVGWCRPGKENLYNICMMEELHTVLSLGCGGVSKLIDRAKGSLVRVSNPKYPQEYIQTIGHICRQKEELVWPTI